MSLTLSSAPATQPLTLAEAKAHLRVDEDDDDDLINALIGAAIKRIDGRDGILGRALITQTWVMKIDRLCEPIVLPLPPLQSVESVEYVDGDGVTQPLTPDQYQVVGIGGRRKAEIVEAYQVSWPTTRDVPEAVTVTFKAGFGDTPSDVPEPIRQAILLMVGAWYEHREEMVVGQSPHLIPFGAKALLTPFKIWSL